MCVISATAIRRCIHALGVVILVRVATSTSYKMSPIFFLGVSCLLHGVQKWITVFFHKHSAHAPEPEPHRRPVRVSETPPPASCTSSYLGVAEAPPKTHCCVVAAAATTVADSRGTAAAAVVLLLPYSCCACEYIRQSSFISFSHSFELHRM